MTTPGGVMVGVSATWITKSPYGLFGMFAKGYWDDVFDQYGEYREDFEKEKDKQENDNE